MAVLKRSASIREPEEVAKKPLEIETYSDQSLSVKEKLHQDRAWGSSAKSSESFFASSFVLTARSYASICAPSGCCHYDQSGKRKKFGKTNPEKVLYENNSLQCRTGTSKTLGSLSGAGQRLGRSC